MTKKLLTLALLFALVAPLALAMVPAQAAPGDNETRVTEDQKRPKPGPTRPKPQGPPGSDDE